MDNQQRIQDLRREKIQHELMNVMLLNGATGLMQHAIDRLTACENEIDRLQTIVDEVKPDALLPRRISDEEAMNKVEASGVLLHRWGEVCAFTARFSLIYGPDPEQRDYLTFGWSIFPGSREDAHRIAIEPITAALKRTPIIRDVGKKTMGPLGPNELLDICNELALYRYASTDEKYTNKRLEIFDKHVWPAIEGFAGGKNYNKRDSARKWYDRYINAIFKAAEARRGD